MVTDFTSTTWAEALRSFLLHVRATRAPKTVRYYGVQLKQVAAWAENGRIPIQTFGKRHMDEYLVSRADSGKAQLTLHHDAVCTKAFLAWCQRNDFVDRNLLSEYRVRNAPHPPKYMPTDEDMHKLLEAMSDYWDVGKNPDVRYSPATKRSFHRDRNSAMILGLLDSACRIGELISLTRDDYQASERKITIRESKGREPRAIPVSADWAEALCGWLKIRARVMAQVPKGEDEGWLFISETGGRLDEGRFLKRLKGYTAFAGVSDKISLHSLRRYSLNRLAKYNLLAAQAIAGHKDTKTTLIYTKIDPDFVRDIHEQVGVVRGILNNKRAVKKKRLV